MGTNTFIYFFIFFRGGGGLGVYESTGPGFSKPINSNPPL